MNLGIESREFRNDFVSERPLYALARSNGKDIPPRFLFIRYRNFRTQG